MRFIRNASTSENCVVIFVAVQTTERQSTLRAKTKSAGNSQNIASTACTVIDRSSKGRPCVLEVGVYSSPPPRIHELIVPKGAIPFFVARFRINFQIGIETGIGAAIDSSHAVVNGSRNRSDTGISLHGAEIVPHM